MAYISANYPSITCPHQERCAACMKYDAAVVAARAAEAQVLMLRAVLNESHNNFRHLPREIVSRIFEIFAGNLTKRRNKPFVLGAVCRSWREIAWSTPRVWTSASLGKLCQNGKDNPFIEQFGEYVKRSGALGIKVAIHRNSNTGLDLTHPDILRVAAIINSCLSRCVSLKIELPVLALHPFFQDLTPESPQILRRLALSVQELEWVEVEEVEVEDRVLDLTSITGALKVLKLEGSSRLIHFDKLKVNTSNLTSISCLGSYTSLTNVIRASPLLKTAIIDLRSGGADGQVENQHPFVHASLQHLELLSNLSSFEHFMELFTFPNLDTLKITKPGEPNDVRPNLVAGFLSRSGQILRQFTLFGSTVFRELSDMLVPLPCLEKFMFDYGVDISASDVVYAMFRDFPGLPSTPSITPPGFPELRFLTSRNEHFPMEEDDWDFLEMITERLDQSNQQSPVLAPTTNRDRKNRRSLPVSLQIELHVGVPSHANRYSMYRRGGHLKIIEELSEMGLHINLFADDRDIFEYYA